jgi:glyoxylase-like metal-dependent hydrolase (beta-lactamase superfamily II)
MEIVPGVHAIDNLRVGRAYLFAEADRLTLIDTGLSGSAEKILAAIDKIGRRPQDLRQIVITHYHADHAGSLADLVERTKAQVLAHSIDAAVVRGERRPGDADRHGFAALLTPIIGRSAAPPAPARVDRELADGDEIDLGGIARIVHAPGHTPGSIAVYLPGRKLVFAGDAAANVFGVGPPQGPLGLFNEDQAAARVSFSKLAALDFDAVFFGHGKPMDKDASLAFRKVAERLGR